MSEISLPCLPGDTVFAFLDDSPRSRTMPKKRTVYDLSECIVTEILLSKDYKEPLITAICYERANYGRFWASDFGAEIFTVEQYFALKPNQQMKPKNEALGVE